jgi:hypothetical protein
MKAEGLRPTLLRPELSGEFKLDPAHVIGPTAERVGDPRVAGEKVAVEIVVHALNAWAEAANVEAAKLRAEEAIGQANGFD